MYVNNARTVSEALSNGLHYLRRAGVAQSSRVGEVLVSPKPVMTIYSDPRNRVLFSPMRDANPFFHLMESLWMLAGRNDLPWLAQFNKRFTAYSDDGGQTQPGAYGYRWRNYFGYDQLEVIIKELKANPQTRRCVLTMWDGGAQWDRGDDAERYQITGRANADDGLGDLAHAVSGSADVPCNTHAYFDTVDGKLNMTVLCRSNDIIWGAYGANAVHFSFLLEYVAAATGLTMGVLRQFSNNFHMYTNVIAENQMMSLARDVDASDRYMDGAYSSRGPASPALRTVPLMPGGPDDNAEFVRALPYFFDDSLPKTPEQWAWHPFMCVVAVPMWNAWQAHKEKDYDKAIRCAEGIYAQDWQMACVQWLQRRQLKRNLNIQRFTEVAPPQMSKDMVSQADAALTEMREVTGIKEASNGAA